MLNILIFSTDYKPNRGGIAEHTYQVAKHLHQLGCKVFVLSISKRGCVEFDLSQPFLTYRVPSVPLFGGLLLFLSLLKVCRREKVDHVYSTITNPCCELAYLGSFFCRYKNVVAVHGYEVSYDGKGLRGWFKRRIRRIRSYIYNRMDRVIAVSGYTRQKLIESGVKPDKIYVVPNGIELKQWEDKSKEETLIKKHGLYGKKVVLSVGRLVKRKNHETAIKALNIVRSRLPDVRYLIAGDGPNERELKRMVKMNQLESHVIFLGDYPQDRLNILYNTCDLFVMPNTQVGSSVEGFGIVFLEANACGKPVIAGRSGGAVDAVVDGETGFLVDPHDEKLLADKIINLLSDTDLASSMGQKGLKRVADQFSWDSVVSRMKVIFEGL